VLFLRLMIVGFILTLVVVGVVGAGRPHLIASFFFVWIFLTILFAVVTIPYPDLLGRCL